MCNELNHKNNTMKGPRLFSALDSSTTLVDPEWSLYQFFQGRMSPAYSSNLAWNAWRRNLREELHDNGQTKENSLPIKREPVYTVIKCHDAASVVFDVTSSDHSKYFFSVEVISRIKDQAASRRALILTNRKQKIRPSVKNKRSHVS